MSLLWFVFSCHTLRVLRYSPQFVTPLAAPASCVRAATLSCIATSFIPVFVPLHYTTRVALLFAARMASHSQHTKARHKRCTCLWQSLPYITRRVPFRYTTSSIYFSSIQYTRCLYLCSPYLPATASGLSPLLYHYTEPPAQNKSTRQTLALYVAV